MRKLSKIAYALIAATAISCASSTAKQAAQPKRESVEESAYPTFCQDSAFAFVKAQTDFGPRVPGSQPWQQCARWLTDKLQQYGATDIEQQRASATAWNGDNVDICNISGRFNPDATTRILLLSHWDSRPWADQEADTALRDKPIDGANDGASGVGVILELCRLMSEQQPDIGVDVLFADAEDYGRRADAATLSDDEDSWCLGTQYWVSHPTIPLDSIQYAILLDMVGGKDAVFSQEMFSAIHAQPYVKKVWNEAKAAGYGARFVNQTGNPIIDDHIYLLRAGVPAIDIVEMNHPQTGSFNPTWHTHKDNIDNIDPTTLKAVGQTLTNLIYKAK